MHCEAHRLWLQVMNFITSHRSEHQNIDSCDVPNSRSSDARNFRTSNIRHFRSSELAHFGCSQLPNL